MSTLETNSIGKYNGNNVSIDDALRFKNYNTTERDALTSVAGDIIYNTSTSKIEFYDGSAWQEAGGVDAFNLEFLINITSELFLILHFLDKYSVTPIPFLPSKFLLIAQLIIPATFFSCAKLWARFRDFITNFEANFIGTLNGSLKFKSMFIIFNELASLWLIIFFTSTILTE